MPGPEQHADFCSFYGISPKVFEPFSIKMFALSPRATLGL